MHGPLKGRQDGDNPSITVKVARSALHIALPPGEGAGERRILEMHAFHVAGWRASPGSIALGP